VYSERNTHFGSDKEMWYDIVEWMIAVYKSILYRRTEYSQSILAK